jgi:hypothetical protein
MHINRGLLGWGVFFIVLGSVPLAVRGGALDPAVVRRAWELWPLLLIGIGLGLVLERTRLAVVGGLIVAVTFGLMGGGLLATGFGPGIGMTTCGVGGGDGERFAERRGTLAPVARVSLAMNCGDLEASTGDGADWLVSGSSHDGTPPDIDASAGVLEVKAPERSGISFVDGGSRWEVTLPRAGTIDIDVSVNAGSARLDLAGLAVPTVDVSVNAGDARIDLGEATGIERIDGSANAGALTITLPPPSGRALTGSLSVNAGSLQLCVPDGVALEFRVDDNTLSSDNFGSRGLVRDGDTWSRGGGSLDAIRLDLSANLGSITLNPEDGCE